MRTFVWAVIGTVALSVASLGCEGDKPAADAGPKTTTLASAKPAAKGAHLFDLQHNSDDKVPEVTFMMDAPKEKIRGTLVKAIRGQISIPLEDITKARGKLFVDLGKLVVVQSKPDADGKFPDFTENKAQNLHARQWLQIDCSEASDDEKAACEKEAKANKNVEFNITKVEAKDKDVSKMKGDTRKVTATVTGDFLLHQSKKTRSAKVEITFTMGSDGKPKSIALKTVEPFIVPLAEHGVEPRSVFGIVAKKTLSEMFATKKVAENAQVTLNFSANFTGIAKGNGAKGAASGASSVKK